MTAAPRLLRTVSQACDADLAQVYCGRHGDTEWAFGNVIPTVGHSNTKRTLRREAGPRSSPAEHFGNIGHSYRELVRFLHKVVVVHEAAADTRAHACKPR